MLCTTCVRTRIRKCDNTKMTCKFTTNAFIIRFALMDIMLSHKYQPHSESGLKEMLMCLFNYFGVVT